MIVRIVFSEALVTADKASRRFAGRALYVADNWEIEQLEPLTVRVTHPTYGSYIVRNVLFRVETDDVRVSDSDFVRMNLPEEYRQLDLESTTESVRPTIVNFCSNAKDFLSEGLGIVLQGGAGVGKTGAAAVVAIAVRKLGKSVFFTNVSELREMIRSRINFDSEQSILERCQTVDLLILDGLRSDELSTKDTFFDPVRLEVLIEGRVARSKSTILTTRLDYAELADHFKGVVSVLKAKSAFVEVTGPDRRASAASSIEARIVVKADSAPAASPISDTEYEEAAEHFKPGKSKVGEYRIPGLKGRGPK